MTTYTAKAQSYYDALKPIDKDRLQPIIELFEKCAPDSAIDYYHPNILYLYVKGQLALGLSPRKNYLSFYVGSHETQHIFQELSVKLGAASQGVGCYRYKKLSDINMDALEEAFTRIGASTHTGGGALQPLE